MKNKMMSNEALSTYCSSLAMLLAAGVQAEEATAVLCGDVQEDEARATAQAIHAHMDENGSLAAAVAATAGVPAYMQQMVAAGEASGRTEAVLNRLADYYDDQARLQQRLRGAVLYPTVLLLVMSLLLLFMLCNVLPVFTQVYTNVAGGVTAASYGYLHLAYVMGWVAFAITLVFGLGVLVVWCLWQSGHAHTQIGGFLARWHLTRAAAQQTALAQFTTAFATYVASGVDTDTAAQKASLVVENAAVKAKIAACSEEMQAGKSFVQAAQEQHLYPALHTRLLASGAATGNLDDALAQLSRRAWEGAADKVKNLTDAVEPTLAALLTVCVGLLLVAVMLPLIGMMGSIG